MDRIIERVIEKKREWGGRVVFQWIKSFGVVLEGFLGHGNRSPRGGKIDRVSRRWYILVSARLENVGRVEGHVGKHATVSDTGERGGERKKGRERELTK